MAGNYEKMLDYYPLLIESAIDFKIESRKILAQHNSKYNQKRTTSSSINCHFIEFNMLNLCGII